MTENVTSYASLVPLCIAFGYDDHEFLCGLMLISGHRLYIYVPHLISYSKEIA